jgi:hypothetical protein
MLYEFDGEVAIYVREIHTVQIETIEELRSLPTVSYDFMLTGLTMNTVTVQPGPRLLFMYTKAKECTHFTPQTLNLGGRTEDSGQRFSNWPTYEQGPI